MSEPTMYAAFVNVIDKSVQNLIQSHPPTQDDLVELSAMAARMLANITVLEQVLGGSKLTDEQVATAVHEHYDRICDAL